MPTDTTIRSAKFADLRGKVAIVTGGAQGIGKATVQHLLAQGMSVSIADADEDALEETAAEFENEGDSLAVLCNVADESSVAHAVKLTIETFGHLNAVVNNAGIAMMGTPVESLSLSEWQKILSVNLTGCFLTTKYAVPHLRKQGGSIVNIASTRALQSETNGEAYAASKGGIVALTHALAVSLGASIRVNCVSPGWIETSEWKKTNQRTTPRHTPADLAQHPCGRVGVPMDIANLAAFLLSDASGFVTGQNFVADGGMTKKMIYV